MALQWMLRIAAAHVDSNACSPLHIPHSALLIPRSVDLAMAADVDEDHISIADFKLKHDTILQIGGDGMETSEPAPQRVRAE